MKKVKELFTRVQQLWVLTKLMKTIWTKSRRNVSQISEGYCYHYWYESSRDNEISCIALYKTLLRIGERFGWFQFLLSQAVSVLGMSRTTALVQEKLEWNFLVQYFNAGSQTNFLGPNTHQEFNLDIIIIVSLSWREWKTLELAPFPKGVAFQVAFCPFVMGVNPP